MSGVQFVYPDTGEAAWWCICAQNDCAAIGIGPFRRREDAERECEPDDCDMAHFVADRVGADMWLELPSLDLGYLDDNCWPLRNEMRRHRDAILEREGKPISPAGKRERMRL